MKSWHSRSSSPVVTPGRHMRLDHVQRLGRQPAGGAHAGEILGLVNGDPPCVRPAVHALRSPPAARRARPGPAALTIMIAQHAQAPGSVQVEASSSAGEPGARARRPCGSALLRAACLAGLLRPDRRAGHLVAGQGGAGLVRFGLAEAGRAAARQVVWPCTLTGFDPHVAGVGGAAGLAGGLAGGRLGARRRRPARSSAAGWMCRGGPAAARRPPALAVETRLRQPAGARAADRHVHAARTPGRAGRPCARRVPGWCAAPSTTPISRTSPRTAEVTRLWPDASV